MKLEEFKKYKLKIINELIIGFVFITEEEFDNRLRKILNEVYQQGRDDKEEDMYENLYG